jgi:hypothetical protein
MMFQAQAMLWSLSLGALLFIPDSSYRNSGAQTNSMRPSTTVNMNQLQPGSAATSIQKARALANGVWGGQGISLEINDSRAEINYDCAHGTITGKILPDRNGKFVAKGFRVQEQGAPTRQEGNGTGQPVTYKGSIAGETMTLKVILSKTKETLGTFTLIRGQDGSVRKCM